jgi:NAD(P)-dependent dehydrogenase (short-subunit alcohol dehydrogenase family)
VVLITGGTSGIGKATALELAKRGGKIYIASNDDENSSELVKELKQESKNEQIFFKYLDLASLESVRKFVEDFKVCEEKLDILINNAGVLIPKKKLTVDGFEMHFAVNYLGHFALTLLLLENLIQSAPSRIIMVSSEIHKIVKFGRDNLNAEIIFQRYRTYAHSKLMVLLFAFELEKRLRGTKVTINSVHPGAAETNIVQQFGSFLRFMYHSIIFTMFFKTPFEAAQTQIRLAVDPELEVISGKYFVASREAIASKATENEEDAKWLWEKSLELTSLKDFNENYTSQTISS